MVRWVHERKPPTHRISERDHPRARRLFEPTEFFVSTPARKARVTQRGVDVAESCQKPGTRPLAEVDRRFGTRLVVEGVRIRPGLAIMPISDREGGQKILSRLALDP